MPSKYKSPGTRALILACVVAAAATGTFSEGSVRLIAWGGAVALLATLACGARSAFWIAPAAAALAVALLATGHPTTLPWIWVLPLCLHPLRGRMGLALNLAAFVIGVGYIAQHFSLPATLLAATSLVIVWLLAQEQRLRAKPLLNREGAQWLLPPAMLDTDARHEQRRVERESLYGEVVIFGCAHSTPSDMQELSRLLYDQLALYERAYRLNDYGIAVLLVANDAKLAEQRRHQLQHAIAPHRIVSHTPLAHLGDRFARYRPRRADPRREAQPWP
ncbi:hypothetical protein EVC62_17545 [Salinicola endophyticus]|uniref:GGDEF domain-containing protein n=1 Tax=Salinicola endophyticus TaxID=1949083 RepID=A0ABY8FPP7_9GAMM|nr:MULTISPECIES: hypothetical protein [Salinicola]WFF43146.1 hypothetical protein EVC62_17545 [Salinicola endophyticus]